MCELTFRGSWVREGRVRRPDGEVRSGDFEKCGSRRWRVHLLKPKPAKVDGFHLFLLLEMCKLREIRGAHSMCIAFGDTGEVVGENSAQLRIATPPLRHQPLVFLTLIGINRNHSAITR